MTTEEAIKILDPATALWEIEYYTGFKGKEAKIAAVEEACRMAVKALKGESVQMIVKISNTSGWGHLNLKDYQRLLEPFELQIHNEKDGNAEATIEINSVQDIIEIASIEARGIVVTKSAEDVFIEIYDDWRE